MKLAPGYSPNVDKFALIQSTVLNRLGFAGDGMQPVFDRANTFAKVVSERKHLEGGCFTSALGDDLDPLSVAVGVSIALKLFATFEQGVLADVLKQMKAEDN